MSTNQVPGYIAANADNLHVGCWAEAPDGSLMQIDSVQGGSVKYSVVDRSGAEPMEYYGELVEPAFKAEFSDAGWTWHDKSPFPWAKLHGGVGTGDMAKAVVAERGLKIALSN
jgi:hypothetical protein